MATTTSIFDEKKAVVSPGSQKFKVEQKTVLADETTDAFLKQTYDKLRRLEEDIQRRKETEAVLL